MATPMPSPMPSMTGGAGGAAGPSNALGGTASGYGMFDNSGFTVNYAPSIGVGGGALPKWLLGALLIAGVVWYAKRKR